MSSGSDTGKLFKTYAKHWGELKGFAMALQSGKNNLGETAVKMNRMMGFGPVLMNSSQVVGMNSKGQFMKEESSGWGEYKLHMLKVQKLMVDNFGVEARANDMISDMADLVHHRAADLAGRGLVCRTARPRQGILADFRACDPVPACHLYRRGHPAVCKEMAVQEILSRARTKLNACLQQVCK